MALGLHGVRAVVLFCVLANTYGAAGQIPASEVTPIPDKDTATIPPGSQTNAAPTPSAADCISDPSLCTGGKPTAAPTGTPPLVGAACTVDTDCESDFYCDCGTETTTQPGDGSPAAPLARTPLASALSLVGMMLAACQQPVAADSCRCKKGARTAASGATPIMADATVQPMVNATGTRRRWRSHASPWQAQPAALAWRH